MAHYHLESFVEEFALPLHAGGAVRISAPLSRRDVLRFRSQASELATEPLRLARQQRARSLVADPPLGDADGHDLALWAAIHNVLFFDHPETGRVWARNRRWAGLERETRRLLEGSRPIELGDALSRHLAVSAMLELVRDDAVVQTSEGELRFSGQPVPRRGLWLAGARGEPRVERVAWVSQPHVPAVARLFSVMLSVSPLTGLLHPEHSHMQWSVLSALPFLKVRSFARAICHAWTRSSDWVATGGVLTGNLLRSLSIPISRDVHGRRVDIRSPSRSGPRRPTLDEQETPALPGPAAPMALPPSSADAGLLLAALIHMHVLRVIDFDARVGFGAHGRDEATSAFLGLPLILDRVAPVLGAPFCGQEPAPLRRRWAEYLEHLAGIVPKAIVTQALHALADRVVQQART